MQEKSLIKQNILKYLDLQGISPYKFYQDSGITRGILAQNNGMSEENTAKFLAYCPEISAEWLLTGNGSMLKNEAEPNPVTLENYKELAEARLDIIDGLKFKVKTLEKELSELKDMRQGSFLYSSVAEPAPELTGKTRK